MTGPVPVAHGLGATGWNGTSKTPRLELERIQRGLVAGVAATCLVSIFAAQVFLVLGLVVYLARLVLRQTRVSRLPLDGPILAFAVWTLLSASFSRDPLVSHESAKKLLLFALFYLAADAMQSEEMRERILDAALLGGVALAAEALIQFYVLGYNTLNQRPKGFLGHYMTMSGLLMGVLVLAAARLAFRSGPWPRPSRRDARALAVLIGALAALTSLQAADLFALEGERLFVAALAGAAATLAMARGPWPGASARVLLAGLAAPLSAWALLVSRTRNAWIGAVIGLGALAVLRAPKTLWLLPGAIGLLLIFRPAPVMERLTLTDASSLDRYFMWQAGIDMIGDKPIFGQGPRMVEKVYPDYRWPGAPNPMTSHLHNNALQIAAERGLPCLVWWLWWVAAVMGDAYREARRGAQGAGWVAPATLAFMAALMAAGLFEYNFGDSEVLMFTLLLCALPYALRRERAALAAA